MVAVGEDLGLVRQVRAAAVDQIDARQPVLPRDLLRAQMLLDRHRIVGAALHRRVVADDHHLPARHAADAGDDARARHFAVVHVAGGELADLEERRARIEQPLDPLARQQFAARRCAARAIFSVPPKRRLGDVGAQLLGERAVMRGARAELFARPQRFCCRSAARSCLAVRPLVEKPCRPPSRCCRRWQSSSERRTARMKAARFVVAASALALGACNTRPRQQCSQAAGRRAPSSASTPRGWTNRSCPATTSTITPTARG